MRLSRDDFLKSEGPATEEVEIPELRGSVLVRGLTGRERDIFELDMLDPRTMRPDVVNMRAKLVSRCCVDDDGVRVFEPEDVDKLGELSASVVGRIYDVAARLSGLSQADLEELAANFGKEAGGGSSSASPGTSARPGPSSSKRQTAAS